MTRVDVHRDGVLKWNAGQQPAASSYLIPPCERKPLAPIVCECDHPIVDRVEDPYGRVEWGCILCGRPRR